MAAVMFVCASVMAGSFWRHVMPCRSPSPTRPSPASSLRFLYGAGLVVIPVIVVYTACVYWVFRGKVRAEMLYD
jgi:cytochrome bd ubiquinol oxidase subunit II